MWTMVEARSANEAYMALIKEFKKNGNSVKGTQNGALLELNNVCIEIMEPRKNIVSNPYRNASRRYYGGEFALYMSGETRLKEYVKYSKKWAEFDVDGSVCSAYGDRIFSIFRDPTGISRYDYALKQLLINKETKNAVVMMRDWTDNRYRYQKDRCCTLFFQVTIRNNRLNMTTFMRSTDFWYGLPYDIFWYTTIMQRMLHNYNAITKEDVSLGTYSHMCTSLHVYEKEKERVLSSVLPYPFEESEYVYIPEKEYSFPVWDADAETELTSFLRWEARFRDERLFDTKFAKELVALRLHSFMETMGSFILNKTNVRLMTLEEVSIRDIAEKEASMSLCVDRKVGCVIVATDGTTHGACNEVTSCNKMCEDKKNRVCSVVHAEIAAIRRCETNGKVPKKAYVTLWPCKNCMDALVSCGVNEISVFGHPHKGSTGKATILDGTIEPRTLLNSIAPFYVKQLNLGLEGCK